MKLSEAIRLGSLTTHQTFGSVVSWNFDGHGGAHPVDTCALGAAAHAKGLLGDFFDPLPIDYDRIHLSFPTLDLLVKDPFLGRTRRVNQIIIDLNDSHKWSREQIANWVEGVERNHTPKNFSDDSVITEEVTIPA